MAELEARIDQNSRLSGRGTEAAPWRSVQHAADTVRAGSTVNVRGGIYEELVSINASGNAVLATSPSEVFRVSSRY
jgi:hypothetical protein